MDNLLMSGASGQQPIRQQMVDVQPSGAPGAPQAPPPSPQDIAAHRAELNVVLKELLGLAQRPQGSLSKRDVFNAVGEMIASGAFSTPDAKRQIITQLSQLPDAEVPIRQAIGARIAAVADLHDRFHAQHGAE